MRKIIPGEIPTKDFHQFMLGTVAPRPIAFVSTVDEEGNPNLAPFSFFNAFSSNPPIVVFSSNRRIGDNTTKDTLANIRATGECVINSVSYRIVRQMAICSVDYPKNVSEFAKSGLTPIPSDHIKPFRVKESHSHMECRVRDVITLGEHGGAGHLVICDVLCIHLDEDVIDERGRIDPDKMDLMGRMGRAYYVRASGAAIHVVPQAYNKIPVGYDNLPESIRLSKHLNGNHIGLLAGMLSFPDQKMVDDLARKDEIGKLIANKDVTALQMKAARLLDEEDVEHAAALLLIADSL